MPGPSDAEKKAAADDATFFERFTNAAGGTGVTLTAIEAATAHGTVDPVAVALIASIGLLGTISNDRKTVSKKLADDPPRSDFDVRTAPQPLGLQLEPLAGADAVGVGAAAAECIEPLWRATILLDAHLRAFERSLGADAVRAEHLAEKRYEEALYWGQRASESLETFSSRAQLAADVFVKDEVELRFRLRSGQVVPQGEATFEEIIPLPALGLIYRTGLPMSRMRATVRVGMVSSTPLLYFATQLRLAAEQSQVLGETLGRFAR